MSNRETDLEAVEPCQFEPEVYRAMSDHNGQRQRQKTTTVEVKEDSTVLTGEPLHGAVLTLQSTAEKNPRHAKHKPFLPRTCTHTYVARTIYALHAVDFARTDAIFTLISAKTTGTKNLQKFL